MTGQCVARCNYTSIIEQLKDAKVNEQTVQNADASSLTCDAAVTSCLGSQLASPGNCWNCGGAFSSDHQCDVSPVKPESVKLASSLNLPPDLGISKQRPSPCEICAEFFPLQWGFLLLVFSTFLEPNVSCCTTTNIYIYIGFVM